jgi:hypothetical protein
MPISKIFTIILLLLVFNVSDAQNVSDAYYQRMSELEKYPNIFIDKPLSNSAKISKKTSSFIRHGRNYTLDNTSLSKLKSYRPKVLAIDINLPDGDTRLILEQVDILTNNEFTLSDGTIHFVDPKEILTYRGYESGNRNSWATITIIENKINVLLANQKGNFEINYDKNTNNYVGFYSKDVIQKHIFSDETDDAHGQIIRLNSENSSRIGNCIEVFIEADFSVYQGLGSNISAVSSWIVTNMNNVAAVYALSDINMKVAANPVIWNASDPYASSTNLGTVRDAFVVFRQNNYSGRIAHLVSFRTLGGGIANGIGGFCATYPTYPGPQCISTNLTGTTQTFPTYSFNTYVMAHEIGHVMGMRHTHACVWNNNLTQIDDCGNVYAANNSQTPEGQSCFNPASPIIPVGGGTIMSNCNLLPATGINLNVGFGPIVGAALRQNFAFAPCLTGACAGVPPSNDNCSEGFLLPLRRNCIPADFLIDNATQASPTVPNFQCFTFTPQPNDVWFKVVAQATSMTIETFQASGGPTDLVMQAYKGLACDGTMIRIGCNDNKTATDLHPRLTMTTNINIGDTIKIRIASKTAGATGAFSICAYDSSLPCHPDFTPLMDFYAMNGGATWISNGGWQGGALGTNCNVCTYYGVTCNSQERVTRIALPFNNITGSGLPSSFANLTFLNTLILNHNQISGNVPTSIVTLPYLLTYDLGFNNLSGTIPGTLGNSTSLKNLYLDHNNLTGPLPTGLTNNNLELINLQNNNLSGCFPPVYSEYCTKSYDFSSNPLLANGVAFSLFCSAGLGIDNDGDTYCSGGLDCNDNNPSINPAVAEICDLIDNNCNGLIDDVTTPQVNNWIGGSGNWNVATNWSTGTIPARCTDVIINAASGITVTIPSGYAANARSLSLSAGRNLVIQSTASITIKHGNNIINNGAITNAGTINIENILNNGLYGLHNYGTFTNQTGGALNVLSSGTRSIQNQSGAIINNSGLITINGNAFNAVSNGIYNEGTFNNYNEIIVENITGTEVVVRPSSGFINHIGGIIRLR